MTVPDALRPIFDFVTHVIVGASGFAIIMCIAAALGLLVQQLELLGFHPYWFTVPAEWFEIWLFWLDLSLFSLFLLAEAIKLARGIIAEAWK